MLWSRWRMLMLAALAVAVLAGCGGDDGGDAGGGQAPAPAQTAPGDTAPAGAPEADTAEVPPGGSDPRALFATNCGSCHTLAAAGTEGQVGPNLDEAQPSQQEVLEAIRTGPGVMPENLLDGAEAEAVARFVAENAGS